MPPDATPLVDADADTEARTKGAGAVGAQHDTRGDPDPASPGPAPPAEADRAAWAEGGEAAGAPHDTCGDPAPEAAADAVESIGSDAPAEAGEETGTDTDEASNLLLRSVANRSMLF